MPLDFSTKESQNLRKEAGAKRPPLRNFPRLPNDLLPARRTSTPRACQGVIPPWADRRSAGHRGQPRQCHSCRCSSSGRSSNAPWRRRNRSAPDPFHRRRYRSISDRRRRRDSGASTGHREGHASATRLNRSESIMIQENFQCIRVRVRVGRQRVCRGNPHRRGAMSPQGRPTRSTRPPLGKPVA